MSSFLLFICVAERKPLLQTSARESKTKQNRKVKEEGQRHVMWVEVQVTDAWR